MDDGTHSRPVDQLAGDGWLLAGPVRLGPVTYAIDVYEIRTSLGDHATSGTEMRVRLLNHQLDAETCQGQLLTLELHDGRRVPGFISRDGARLVRTGVLV
jgi:hypothetical protein